ncbi:plasma-membrane proton-e [Gonapodya prolifera JEL478]|uniref:Plasma-membrane proton-e n=1 Tax=Gonapodya prolifera (strain JEL478) TaxID=1344416 RepID=A0A139AWH5_GONPJ|nr:plasma-membrane proton-e [Gonapodya prolifera JEL478]|eukprot:KXS21078.1 plasma-membrane proton-e [Gonapodya prolifera JEL478]
MSEAKDKPTGDAPVHVEVSDEISPELEALLQTNPLQGLTSDEAAKRLTDFGLNEIPEKKTNPFLKFGMYFWGPLPWLIELACVVSGVVGDWTDFGIILALLFVNAVIGYYEEAKAENALDALKNTLALKSRVWRDGRLGEIESNHLVPGDIVALRLGDIVPADVRLLGLSTTGEPTTSPLHIDQSALTGESLPVTKDKGAIAYSSSTVKQGQMLGVVVKTGINTFIGRAANLISITNEQGHFQKIVNAIGNFLILITLVMVAIILAVRMAKDKLGFLTALQEVVVLTIAAIPIGLPTVMSVTMAVGASQLSKKNVIVKRLPAIEEFASVSVLCSDKTGTLTLNQLQFDVPWLPVRSAVASTWLGVPEGNKFTNEDLLLSSYLASEAGTHDAIEKAVRTAAEQQVGVLKTKDEHDHGVPGYHITNFVPFNPTSKYTEATVKEHASGKTFRVIKGAPHVIIHLCGGNEEADKAVIDFAGRGLRALGVGRTFDDSAEKFELIGLISLLDPPRPDSGHTIRECDALGVNVKMITANVGIAVEGCTDAARSAADIVLLSSGLSTIVDGIKTSRAIFQRMRSYAVYRIASTIHFLVFFFITLLAFKFSLPDKLIILIAVMNDAATLVIAIDNTKISQKPDKWRIGQLLTLSFVLAICITGLSFAHYFIARDVFNLPVEQIQTIMYLQISSCPHFMIFSTRLPSWFWENRPSWLFILAVGGTQVFALFMSIFGINGLCVAVGPAWGLTVICISLLSLFPLDFVKVMIIRYWSFEVTATLAPTPGRRAKLAKRKETNARLARVKLTMSKFRRAVYEMVFLTSLWGSWERMVALMSGGRLLEHGAGFNTNGGSSAGVSEAKLLPADMKEKEVEIEEIVQH